MDRLGDVPLDFKYGGSDTGIGLVMDCSGADGAFRMVVTIVMVVKGLYQGGKEEERYENK